MYLALLPDVRAILNVGILVGKGLYSVLLVLCFAEQTAAPQGSHGCSGILIVADGQRG